MKRSDRVLRKCLGRCGKMFKSNGRGNRICPNCKKINDALVFARKDELLLQRGRKYWCGFEIESKAN